ncbi:MAG: zf-HC2 domain-containing protein [Pelotomaculum sp.]|jgi:hypothetical protein
MRCEKFIKRFNDLLDRTLSPRDEQAVRAHLANCRHCRDEFQMVKAADDMLRTTVLDMLNSIEVPPNLNQRIEHALADQVKLSGGGNRFFNLLKTPAFAAAMLALVLITGYFGFQKYYLPQQTNPSVALFNDQTRLGADEAGNISTKSLSPLEPTPPETTAASAAKETAPAEDPVETAPPAVVEPAGDALKNPGQQATGRYLETNDSRSGITGMQQDTAAAGAGNPEPKQKAANGEGVAAGEDSFIPMATSDPGVDARMFSIADTAKPHSGTLEEAAREVGFVPVVPDYLPSQARLIDVTWETGIVYQNYQVGRESFRISQSRVGAAGASGQGGQIIYINGVKAYLVIENQGVAQQSGYTTLCWQLDEWLFTIEGDIPREGIIRTASSIKI